ncbi:sensor histidine kinase [Acetivibrio cellulolyticus]|uniref:sensor histidine kinase n=1 Tax=Acetivibrio cellulolyticus TaxID=35830 RepID=UPI0001E30569|nr:HAMP domain-containing sensor histidine kinase [Acetivibrio cellulolyticus]
MYNVVSYNGLQAVLMILIFAAGVLIGATVFVVINRIRSQRLLKRLEKIIDNVTLGSFNEETFDESILSALESKLKREFGILSSNQKALFEERNKIKTLISDISHQTKTPISNILLYINLLSEESLTEDQKRLVSEVERQSDKLSFLIQSLVKMSRMETGIISVKPQKCSVKKLIEECAANLSPKVSAKQITISQSCNDIEAVFDHKWTCEAVMNILDNAVKYTSESGKVIISATAYEMFVRIDICDNGMGISEDEQAKIFQRFYRSPQVHSEEGVGIGLYLAREIICAQGGYIKVDSKVGRGSTFSVFLPHG